MSSIQSNSAAVRGLLAIPRNAAPVSAGPRRFTQSTDHAMTHAWSIGTTRAAQPGLVERPAASEKTAVRQAEQAYGECPPEVYIG